MKYSNISYTNVHAIGTHKNIINHDYNSLLVDWNG